MKKRQAKKNVKKLERAVEEFNQKVSDELYQYLINAPVRSVTDEQFCEDLTTIFDYTGINSFYLDNTASIGYAKR